MHAAPDEGLQRNSGNLRRATSPPPYERDQQEMKQEMVIAEPFVE